MIKHVIMGDPGLCDLKKGARIHLSGFGAGSGDYEVSRVGWAGKVAPELAEGPSDTTVAVELVYVGQDKRTDD